MILKPVNFERIYAQNPGLILNGEAMRTRNAAREIITNVIRDGEATLSFVPTCECGDPSMSGEFNVGKICRFCGTEVSERFADVFDYETWIEIPDGFPPVLHPLAYLKLSNWLNKTLTAILDPRVENEKLDKYIHGRGYTYFYENFKEIIDVLATVYPQTSKKDVAADTVEYLNRYSDTIFCRHLPIASSSLNVMTVNKGRKSFDPQAEVILRAVVEISESEMAVRNGIKRPGYVDKSILGFSELYMEYVIGIIKRNNKKEGPVKHEGFGSRMMFTGRAVIIPALGVHDPDETYIPWKLFVAVYQLQIINKLVNVYGYTVPDALGVHREASYRYVPVIDEIAQTLIKESPFGGLVVLIGRNPTINFGSAQTLRVTKVKTNPDDCTINFSTSIVERPNADFDGDQLWMVALLEMSMVRKLMVMHPMHTMLSQANPEIDTSVTPCKQLCIQCGSWLREEMAVIGETPFKMEKSK